MSASNGFEGFSRCVSSERGPSRRLLLTTEDWIDDFSSSGSSDSVIPHAVIDADLLGGKNDAWLLLRSD
jgi:hypothetical protein